MSSFTSNSFSFTPSALTAQQAYDAHMSTLPMGDVLVILAAALDHRAQRFSSLVTDQANLVEQTNAELGEVHDVMSMFNTALSASSSKQDTDLCMVFRGDTQPAAQAKAALLSKWLGPQTQIVIVPVGVGWEVQMQKQLITSSNQNMQLKVDDETSESQAEQTRAQSFMNKYSAVIEAASASEKKGTELMLSVIASLGTTS